MFGSGRVRAHGLEPLRSLVYTVEQPQPHYGEYLIGLLLLFLELMPNSKMRARGNFSNFFPSFFWQPISSSSSLAFSKSFFYTVALPLIFKSKLCKIQMNGILSKIFVKLKIIKFGFAHLLLQIILQKNCDVWLVCLPYIMTK